jgi:uncharacterized protein (TIGR03435 family)
MRTVLFSLLLSGVGCVLAQSADSSPKFEVAAIRPGNAPAGRGAGIQPGLYGCTGGPGTPDPGTLRCNVSFGELLRMAYQLMPYQFTAADWMRTSWFEIDAKIPVGSTKEQLFVMQQNLLAERFKLAVHWDKKQMQIYEMAVGKDGPKFKEWVDLPPLAPGATPYDRPKSAGPLKASDLRPNPDSPTEWQTIYGSHSRRGKMSMNDLGAYLSVQLDQPVINSTGLKGEYDIMLDYVMEPRPLPGRAPNPDPPPLAAGPTLLKAVESQLGLKLESKKGTIDVLVIDHIDKTPTEN